MRTLARAALGLLALTGSAGAADDPAIIKGSNDTRVRTVDYSEKNVTNIVSTDFVPIVITYGEGEVVTLIAGRAVVPINVQEPATAENVAKATAACTELGKTQAAWCADRHSNEFTLTPMHSDDGSLLVLTTKKTDPVTSRVIHHHYAYALSTRTGDMVNGKDAKSYFRVQYTYTVEEAAQRAAEWRSTHVNDVSAVEKQKAADRLTLASKIDPKRSSNWFKNDSPDCRALGPLWTADDGRQTVMHFAMNTEVSLPSYPGEKPGDETTANYTPEIAPDSGLTWTFPIVPKAIFLRRGKAVCGIYNTTYDAHASTPYTGTASPDVVRGVK